MAEDRREDDKVDEAVEDMRSDAEEMRARSRKLGERIDDAKSDWRTKQQDDAVPGALAPSDDQAEHPPSKST